MSLFNYPNRVSVRIWEYVSDTKSKLQNEFSELNDTIAQWSDLGESLLANSLNKAGYDELSALLKNIHVSYLVKKR